MSPAGSSSRDVDALQRQLAAALVWCASDEVVSDLTTTMLRMLRVVGHVWGAGAEHVPALAIIDFAMVVWRGRAFSFASARRAASFHDDERAVRLAWEDRVVAPWVMQEGLAQAHVSVAVLHDAALEHALAHAALAALPRLLEDRRSGPTGSGPPDREDDAGASNDDDARERDHAGQVPDEDVRVRQDDDADVAVPRRVMNLRGDVVALRGVIDRWTGALRPQSLDDLVALIDEPTRAATIAWLRAATPRLAGHPPLRDEELWELAHLHELPSEALRLALRTVHALVVRIQPASASTTLLLRRRVREVPVDVRAADVYPTGGFDAMSTRGTIENLVRSEVAWVGEGTSAGSTLDLFDVRYVEGELLYYTRDDSPLLEEKKHLHIVIDDLPRLRHKVRALPAQTLVLVQAMALRAHADLLEALGPLAVATTISLCGDDNAVLAEEAASLAVSLAADIAHRRARVQVASSIDGIVQPHSIVFSPQPPPFPRAASHASRCGSWWIHVGAGCWTVHGATLHEPSLSVRADETAALRALLDRVVLSL